MCAACVGARAAAVTQLVQPAANVAAGSDGLELAAAESSSSGPKVVERPLSGSRLLTEVKGNLTAGASMAGNARKLGWAMAEDAAEMEMTLDEIAADVSQVEAGELAAFLKSGLT
jgi:hypothetical protein